MTESSRWQPGTWRNVARVAVAGRAGYNLSDPTSSALRASGAEIVQTPLRDERGVVPDVVADADLLITGGVPVDEAVFRALRRVRFVLRPYVGYDDIDVAAATEVGILVANVPDTFVEEVANHTLALILGANRKLLPMDRLVRSGGWANLGRARQAARPIRRLSSLTLGLVGFGTIGRLVLDRARPFGFRVLASDPYVSPSVAEQAGVTLVELDQLLAESDVVSLHVFLSSETRKLIDARRLALMKPGAYLVNTSRGPVVDEAALIEALRAGRIAGAALDVFEEEPLSADSPLAQMENVLLTPHLASYSEEGDARHYLRVAEIGLQVLKGGLPERKVVVNKDLYDRIAVLPELQSLPRG